MAPHPHRLGILGKSSPRLAIAGHAAPEVDESAGSSAPLLVAPEAETCQSEDVIALLSPARRAHSIVLANQCLGGREVSIDAHGPLASDRRMLVVLVDNLMAAASTSRRGCCANMAIRHRCASASMRWSWG